MLNGLWERSKLTPVL